MTNRCLMVLAAVLVLATFVSAQDRETLISWILEDPSWNLDSEPIEYGVEDLDSLVGDNASAIRQYGIIGASRLDLRGVEGAVQATLYEMLDSTAAYGLFALERDWRRPGFELAVTGTESYRQSEELVFWQSKYVGKLRGDSRATTALGDWFTDNIVGGSKKAPVSLHLPPGGLVAESEKYILDRTAFEDTAGFDAAQLGFENSVEVAVAEYGTVDGSAQLAMLLYPTQQLAKLHSEAWVADVDSRLRHVRSGPLFAIVLASTDPELSESILSTVGYESEATWVETLPDPLTLRHMILTIFTFTGIALSFTLIVGLGFGGFRIYMKTRYPGWVFRSEKELEFIQLNLYQSVKEKQLNP